VAVVGVGCCEPGLVQAIATTATTIDDETLKLAKVRTRTSTVKRYGGRLHGGEAPRVNRWAALGFDGHGLGNGDTVRALMRLSAANLARMAPLAWLACLAAYAACSSNSPSSSTPPAADGSFGPLQPVGAGCNETLANPCLAASTGCSVVACLAGVCTLTPLAEDPSCADVALPMTNTICDSGAACASGVCGFLVAEGCSVVGVCVEPVDASAALPPACGCSGLPVPYVAVGFTAAPASSPGACVDGGSAEAGDDAGDGGAGDGEGEDAGSDASDAGDAASE
jgi:hypothetical protein